MSIGGTPLVVLFYLSATHSFVLRACVQKLNLHVSSLKFDLVVDTTTSGLDTTFDVCLNCPVMIYDSHFVVDSICFSLSQLDVILGMY